MKNDIPLVVALDGEFKRMNSGRRVASLVAQTDDFMRNGAVERPRYIYRLAAIMEPPHDPGPTTTYYDEDGEEIL